MLSTIIYIFSIPIKKIINLNGQYFPTFFHLAFLYINDFFCSADLPIEKTRNFFYQN